MISVLERMPLALNVGIETPTGQRFKLSADDPDPRNSADELTFSTVAPGGHESLSFNVKRDPAFTYPDIQELSTYVAYGAGELTASEARVETLPDQSGDQIAITPGAVGWQSHLNDDSSAREIFVDQDITTWGNMPLNRQIQLTTDSGSTGVGLSGPSTGPAGADGIPALVETITGEWGAAQSVEAWYDANGLPIGKLWAAWQNLNPVLWSLGTTPSWQSEIGLSSDDVATSVDLSGPLSGDSGTELLNATDDAKVWAVISFTVAEFFNEADTSGVSFSMAFNPGVYGTHGLPLYDTADVGYAQGILAADAIAYGIGKWCPALNYTTGENGSIQPSSFVIPHAVFTSPGPFATMLNELISYEILDWFVWDKRMFYLNARGARARTWRARSGDVNLQRTGANIARIWNGAVVQWNDVSGVTRTVGPPGSGCNFSDSSLLDPDPNNPINQYAAATGIPLKKYMPVPVPTVSTLSAATRFGQLALQAQKLADTSGQATLNGYVQDAATGIYWPGWLVRGGDSLIVTDAADTSPRRIVHTQWNDAAKTNALQLDQPPDTEAALYARTSVDLSPFGLS